MIAAELFLTKNTFHELAAVIHKKPDRLHLRVYLLEESLKRRMTHAMGCLVFGEPVRGVLSRKSPFLKRKAALTTAIGIPVKKARIESEKPEENFDEMFSRMIMSLKEAKLERPPSSFNIQPRLENLPSYKSSTSSMGAAFVDLEENEMATEDSVFSDTESSASCDSEKPSLSDTDF